MIKRIINSDTASILIPVTGFGFQFASGIILFAFSMISHFMTIGNITPILQTMITAGAGVVFVIPLFGLIGLYISIRNIIKKDHILLNILGLTLNILWLSFIFLIFLLAFIGISV